jgi:predicted phage-related endonuclease
VSKELYIAELDRIAAELEAAGMPADAAYQAAGDLAYPAMRERLFDMTAASIGRTAPMRDLLNCGYAEVAALLAHDTAWHEARRKGIGGSDASIIMAGDPAALIALWEEKSGKGEPADLSDVVPVVIGTLTEPANRYFYTKRTGRGITAAGEMVVSKTHPFMRCTLDGITATADGKSAVFEAKHVGGFEPIETVVGRYQPQIHHAMHVAGLNRAVLSIFVGTRSWEMFEIECDDFYLAQLIDREREFWRCVESGEPPVQTATVAAPAMPTKFRTVSMEGNNTWASNAADWLANQTAAKSFEMASREIKALVEPDVGTATGHGIEVKRSKAGALTIKAEKPPKAVKEAA